MDTDRVENIGKIREQLRVLSGETIIITDPIEFQGGVKFLQVPSTPIGKSNPSATSISALNTTRLKLYSTVATTLTDFPGGSEGQPLVVLGDGFTTITHGTKIFTNTGGNKLMVANRIYVFYSFFNLWYEH